MCISIIRYLEPTSKVVYAFKAFAVHHKRLYFPYFGHLVNTRKLNRKEWLKTDRTPGFHAFYSKEDAEKWGHAHIDNGLSNSFKMSVRKVALRKVYAAGTEGTYDVGEAMVAKEMRLL